MQLKKLVIYEYEQILSGHSARFNAAFEKIVIRKYAGKPNETTEKNNGTAVMRRNRQAAKILWHYAITEILRWDPETALKCLTPELAKQLYLDRTYKYIGVVPRNIEEFREYIYVIFEKELHYDYEKHCIDVYNSVQKNKSLKFPKNFFNREDGKDAGAIILNYLVNEKLSHMSSEELYDFFDSPEVFEWLSKNSLMRAMEETYVDPLEFLHYSLSPSRRDDLSYYRILIARKAKEAIPPET